MKLTAEQIAQVAHEVNRAYCQAIGDEYLPTWDLAPTWQKESMINGVKLHQQNPDTTPEQSHENWLKQKEVEGWVYGHKKDLATKQHPCLVPYAELPASQKAKDYLFKTIVKQLSNL